MFWLVSFPALSTLFHGILLSSNTFLTHSFSISHAGGTTKSYKNKAILCPISRRDTHRNGNSYRSSVLAASTFTKDEVKEETVDVVVIGSGFGGLSCAALCAKYGLDVVCVEAHDTPGGVAHSFVRYGGKNSKGSGDRKQAFQFDSGPSLISGVSQKGSNPLRQVLDAVGTADEVEWCTYDGWLVHDYADGKSIKLTTGNRGEWEKAIEEKVGKESRMEFERFKEAMLANNGLTEVSGYIPPFALRSDLYALRSMSSYLFKFLSIGLRGALLTGPFTTVMDKYHLHDDFCRKWFDYLAFALSGLDAAHTQAAPVLYTMGDLHKPGTVLDYPMGGMDALINALVKGITNNGGELRLNTRVEKIILGNTTDDTNMCQGVVLQDGSIIKAKKGVVSNAPLWNMAKILEDSLDGKQIDPVVKAVKEIQKKADDMEMTGTFMHLHLGIPIDGMDDNLECHHSMLNMDKDITAEQNLVIVSIPTVFDPSLAPDGYHIVHAYTAASESFDDWEPFLDKGKDEGKVGTSPNTSKAAKYAIEEGYQQLKEQKADALWKALETIIPDIRERSKMPGSVVLVGSPLTHRRYNQRFKGTYGPAPAKGADVWDLPSASTPIKGLFACGDTCFPGIGLPGVAASGTIAANSLVDVDVQLKLMDDLKLKGALQ